MVDTANHFGLILLNALLQSTAIFAVGLLVARTIARQPARVHAVLALTFVAAIAAPAASELVRQCGWGLLIPPAMKSGAPAVAMTDEPATKLPAATAAPTGETAPGRLEVKPPIGSLSTEKLHNPLSSHASNATTSAPPATRGPAADAQSTGSLLPRAAARSWWVLAIWILATAWLVASATSAGRLLGGVIAGRRLLTTAVPCAEPTVMAALAAARQRLELDRLPIDVFKSRDLHCPVIWCWSSRPSLLLPVGAADDWTTAKWTPILCHELAHWKRRDHYSALVAEVVCCLLPWQPLAWWAKRRLEEASEQACDDWTVAAGHAAPDYAETLLGLVAQADPPLALAALRRRSGLAIRVRHILSQAVPRPRLGRVWAIAVLGATAAGVVAAALCQRGVARADSPAPVKVGDSATQKPPAAADAKPPAAGMAGRSPRGPTATGVFMAGVKLPPGSTVRAPQGADDKSDKHHKVAGRVFKPDGQPMPDADVIWKVTLRPARDNMRWPGPQEHARTKTDAEGHFTMEVTVPHNASNHNLVFHSPKFGVRASAPRLDNQPMEVRFDTTYPIVGTVFTADGAPVKDARVIVRSMNCQFNAQGPRTNKGEPWNAGLSDDDVKSGKPKDYWPAPAVTDAQGQFRFDNVVQRLATVELYVIAKDFPVTRVNVAGPEAQHWDDESTVWREPTFMLVLENPFVVEGRFLDEKTSKPIKDVRLEINPYNNRRGMHEIERIEVTSDDDGRYTVRAGSADMYFIKIFPPAGYPGLNNSISARQIEQAKRADGKIGYELKLRPGVMVRGRVVDADGGKPVAGAEVVYQPTKGRKLGLNNDFRPVTTADDGTFELTGADGKGFLLVDAPDKGFYRLSVHDARLPMIHEGFYPHGLLEIDVPAAGQIEPYEMSLHRGPALVGRALDPSGNPLTQFVAACVGRQMDGYLTNEQCQDGFFHLDAVEPGRKYRVYLYSEATHSGATAEIVAPADGSVVDVPLQPCGTIRGRYIYESGVPVPEIMNFTKFRVDPDQAPPHENARMNMPFYGNFAGGHDKNRTTDAEGRFELGDIVPGAFVYLNTNFEFAADGDRSHPVGLLKPGEVRDVGELVIRPN